MKNTFFTLITLVSMLMSFAQSPEGMSYQAIVRDSGNALVTEQPVGVQISILQGSATGTAVYAETHTATTNTNGLLTLVIGTGSTADDFSAIDWANGPYFIKTETDPMGGTNYSITATSQMLSVPYALYAKTAGTTQQATPTLTSVLQQNNSAGGQQIKGLADPTDAQDAVTLAYVNQLETSIQDLQDQLNNQLNDIDNDYDGYTENQGDCNDSDANLSPGVAEICDGVDNDCDGQVDEDAVDGVVWYADTDSDGYGDANNTLQSCTQPDGYVSQDGDCDDSSASINPGASEICDGIDNDCDGQVDEDAVDGLVWYADTDSDGYGDANNTVQSCTQPDGYVAQDGDCDDSSASINPGASEICDGIDNDCDGQTDEDGVVWYADTDSDGYGDANNTVQSCAQPDGYVAQDGDCDDSNTSINPGAAEICDGIDNDCDGQVDEDGLVWYADTDSDGYGDANNTVQSCTQPDGYVAQDGDCDDSNADVNPDATDIVDNIDNDCDGNIDGSSVVDVDGNTYVFITYNGGHRWTLENAEMVTYRDGTPIPQVTDPTEWANLTTGAWCYYDNDPSKGKLYNWYAVAGIHDTDPNTPNKELAPEGWHVPTDADWAILQDLIIAYGGNYDYTTTDNKIAKAMASTTGWNSSPFVGTPGYYQEWNNWSLFNAFPVGIRGNNGSFIEEGYGTYFWCSNESLPNQAWFRYLINDGIDLGIYLTGFGEYYQHYGFSVRFVKDE